MSEPVPWLVCHTRPRCEKKFAALMRAEGFEHYLPLVSSARRYGTRTRTFTKPLFTGYVFAAVPAELKSRIYQQELLARAIAVPEREKFLRQLEEVRLLVASGLDLSVRPLLRKGKRARIKAGPLYGLIGIVENPDAPRGIIVAVDVLQQGVLVTVPVEHLEPLD
jgi:transcription antitermination factor NusG